MEIISTMTEQIKHTEHLLQAHQLKMYDDGWQLKSGPNVPRK